MLCAGVRRSGRSLRLCTLARLGRILFLLFQRLGANRGVALHVVLFFRLQAATARQCLMQRGLLKRKIAITNWLLHAHLTLREGWTERQVYKDRGCDSNRR